MKQTDQIQGWFNYPQTFRILVDSIPDGGTFVECGAWLGKSSSMLCDYSKDRINVYIVDTWQGSPNEINSNHKLATATDIYNVFLENMGERKFTPIRKDSLEAAQDFQDESCDVVFIDMTHTYEAVKLDIEAWYPKVKQGGYLAGHDYFMAGVSKAVNEFFPQNVKSMQGSCWVYKKELSI